MKILMFGDVFAKPGRDALKLAIEKLRRIHLPEFIIVNGENLAHGKGITPKLAEELFSWGIDVITTGNHAWDQNESHAYFDQCERLLRPLNYGSGEPRIPGKGVVIVANRDRPSLKLAVVLVMGRVFMDPLDCPFRAADAEVARLRSQGVHNILVDFHGEASSEKQAFAHFMNGKISAVVGTHSHVQTADERVLSEGTAAITDVGMTGCFDSVIGAKKELIIRRFLTKMPTKIEPAEGPGGYGCVVITVDEKTGRAQNIERIREVVI